MTMNKVMPQPGETIALLCLDCKKTFFGPNPKFIGWFERLYKKPVCHQCGGKRVVPNPFVMYKD